MVSPGNHKQDPRVYAVSFLFKVLQRSEINGVRRAPDDYLSERKTLAVHLHCHEWQDWVLFLWLAVDTTFSLPVDPLGSLRLLPCLVT